MKWNERKCLEAFQTEISALSYDQVTKTLQEATHLFTAIWPSLGSYMQLIYSDINVDVPY